MASRTRVLYCGMTNSLDRRVEEHKTGRTPGFTSEYCCERLVWFERYQYVRNAIAREKEIKSWTRAKKLALINEQNPFFVIPSAARDLQFSVPLTEPSIC